MARGQGGPVPQTRSRHTRAHLAITLTASSDGACVNPEPCIGSSPKTSHILEVVMDGGSGAPGTSNAWHRQRRNKGKGKGNGREGHVIEASAAQLFLNADDTAQESNGGEEELQDYHEAMDDILGSSTSRGKSKDEATAAIANGDSHHHTDLPDSDREHDEGPEDGFVYDGVDDEDTNEFRREAGIIDSEQYKSTLKDILDEDEEGPESSEPLARTELKAHAQSSSGEASKVSTDGPSASKTRAVRTRKTDTLMTSSSSPILYSRSHRYRQSRLSHFHHQAHRHHQQHLPPISDQPLNHLTAPMEQVDSHLQGPVMWQALQDHVYPPMLRPPLSADRPISRHGALR